MAKMLKALSRLPIVNYSEYKDYGTTDFYDYEAGESYWPVPSQLSSTKKTNPKQPELPQPQLLDDVPEGASSNLTKL